MERHKCKQCLRSFPNGRALGGHMRSHNLYRSGSIEVQQEQTGSAGSASLSLSSDDDERDSMCYGLRKDPKKSVKLADPEFSFVEPVPVQVQDRESEAESAKHPVRRRSNRFRNPDRSPGSEPDPKPAKPGRVAKPEWSEPVSSVSDTTTEEDVAFCLMMMRRDKWRREKASEDESEEDDDDVAEVEEDFISTKKRKKAAKNRYKCETCERVFKSYQALGGHRASHKRAKIANINNNNNSNNNNDIIINDSIVSSSLKAENEEKTHECPICFRVFSSGQALGGHKRSHVVGSSSSSIFVEPKQGIRIKEKALIDLNLPAPIEDEEDDDVYSQIELSALSEADFVINSNRH